MRWPTAGRCLPVPRRCRPAGTPTPLRARARAATRGSYIPSYTSWYPLGAPRSSAATPTHVRLRAARHLPASSRLPRPGPSRLPVHPPCPRALGLEKKAQWGRRNNEGRTPAASLRVSRALARRLPRGAHARPRRAVTAESGLKRRYSGLSQRARQPEPAGPDR